MSKKSGAKMGRGQVTTPVTEKYQLCLLRTPSMGWSANSVRIGTGADRLTNRTPPLWSLPRFAGYLESSIRRDLTATENAQLTPTLAATYPDLAAEYPVRDYPVCGEIISSEATDVQLNGNEIGLLPRTEGAEREILAYLQAESTVS